MTLEADHLVRDTPAPPARFKVRGLGVEGFGFEVGILGLGFWVWGFGFGV